MVVVVLIPDHFHGLLVVNEMPLKQVISDLKGRSSFQINNQLNRKGTLWQKQYYEHAIRHNEDLKNTARYIVANPLRKTIVQKIQDYPYWNSVYL